MSIDSARHDTDDETIALLVEHNPDQADRLLREMGYSLEEWQRHRNAPPAVEHGHRGMPAAPAVSQSALDGLPAPAGKGRTKGALPATT